MDGSTLEHRHLRRALEFVVTITLEGQKLRPPLAYPPRLKQYLKMNRLPSTALGPVRRIVEGDPEFRARVAAGALPELVDPIGMLWLQRPDGWERQIDDLLAEARADEAAAEAGVELQRERKRREGAEAAAARTRVELVELRERVAALTDERDLARAEIVKLEDERAELRIEIKDLRIEKRHARDRENAATGRLDDLQAQLEAARREQQSAEGVRDDVLASRTAVAAELAELASLAARAEDLAAALAAAADRASPAQRREGVRRRPLSLPGGVLGDSTAATEHLVRSGASIFVDGYNVAKLGWPDLDLANQRRVLVDCVENIARRYGADLTIVFDGAEVVGATADQRRLVRVVFSPPGVIADDVIRDEVTRLPASRAVVVVTNDNEILNDVRAVGANTISSDRFLKIACR